MTSNRSLRLSIEAEDDLADLFQYTLDMWGLEQAVTYRATVEKALRELLPFPALGRRRDDLGVGYRSRVVEQHVIYYRIEDDAIQVNRILHVRRKPAGQLTE